MDQCQRWVGLQEVVEVEAEDQARVFGANYWKKEKKVQELFKLFHCGVLNL